MTPQQISQVQSYLRKRFSNEAIELVLRFISMMKSLAFFTSMTKIKMTFHMT